MRIGLAYEEQSENSFSVVFKITDAEAFKPERTRLCNGMAVPTSIPGGRVCTLANGDLSLYQDYSDYLLQYIDDRLDNHTFCVLTFAEWLENGSPEKHDVTKQYKLLED